GDFARDQYVRQGGTTDENGNFHARRSFGNIALNTILGLARGASTGQGLGAALGGALAGGLGSAISPTLGRESTFNTFQLPAIQAGMAKQAQQQAQQQQQAALQRQAILDASKLENQQSQTTLRNARAQSILNPAPKQEKPLPPHWV